MPKILVVEDTQETREFLHLYFTNAGFTVVTASDGAEGLYMAQSEKPDLIVTDIAMPKMNGIEMMKHPHSDSRTAEIPILVFTARSSALAEDVKQAGVDEEFYKPFDFDERVRMVKGMVRK